MLGGTLIASPSDGNARVEKGKNGNPSAKRVTVSPTDPAGLPANDRICCLKNILSPGTLIAHLLRKRNGAQLTMLGIAAIFTLNIWQDR